MASSMARLVRSTLQYSKAFHGRIFQTRTLASSKKFHFDFISPDLPSKCTWTATGGQSPHHHERKTKPKILPDILADVGETPVCRLNRLPRDHGLDCEVLGKCEFLNPGGSVKDRIILRMIEDAEREGKIKPGATLIEPSSGNTGIGLALACAVKGYRCIIVMPHKISNEKEVLIKSLGAEVVRTPTEAAFDDESSHFVMAQKLSSQIPNSFVLDQFRNPSNPLAHYDTTANEIIEQCDGQLDVIVAGAGTGGTLTGLARRIKEAIPKCKVVCVDPTLSNMAPSSTTNTGVWEIEGIGYDFVPTNLDRNIVDHWVKVDDKDAFRMSRSLIRREGLLVGGSSGAMVYGAIQVAKKLHLGGGQRILAILPDGVRNYMTKFVDDQWMKDRKFL